MMKTTLGAAFVYPLLLALGCSSSNGGGDPPSFGSGASANNGGTGSTGNNNGGNGAYQFTGGSATTGTGVDLDSGCASQSQPAQLTRVNILFLLDNLAVWEMTRMASGRTPRIGGTPL